MHEHSLARELWPQLKQIADARGLGRVRRLEMIVGMLHGVSAEMLVHSFAHAFEGTSFEGAEVLITDRRAGPGVHASQRLPAHHRPRLGTADCADGRGRRRRQKVQGRREKRGGRLLPASLGARRAGG